jgi:hypothetical protein
MTTTVESSEPFDAAGVADVDAFMSRVELEQAAARTAVTRVRDTFTGCRVLPPAAAVATLSAPNVLGGFEAFHRPSAEEVLVKDLGHVGGLYTDVHDAVRIDQDVGAELARPEATGAGDLHAPPGFTILQCPAELLHQVRPATFGARPLGAARRPFVEADKDVFLRFGHETTPRLLVVDKNSLNAANVPNALD